MPYDRFTAIGDYLNAARKLLVPASLYSYGTAAEPKSVNTQVEDSVPNAEPTSSVPYDRFTAIGDYLNAARKLLVAASLYSYVTAAQSNGANKQVGECVPNAMSRFTCAGWVADSHRRRLDCGSEDVGASMPMQLRRRR